jgi:cytochrome c oxidase subunit 2
MEILSMLNQGMQVLHKNIASFGAMLDDVTWTVTVIILFWGGLAMILTIAFSLMSLRKQGVKADGTLKGEGFAQTKWILIPVILVTMCDAVVDIKTTAAWAEIKGPVAKKIKENKIKDPLEVMIFASKYYWKFTYAGPDGKINTDDDIVSRDILRVPVDRDIVWHLTADDVMHSFWVKNLRLKQDALPGRVIRGWFHIKSDLVNKDGKVDLSAPIELDLNKPGAIDVVKANLDKRIYEIACAEICGSTNTEVMKGNRITTGTFGGGHHNMAGYLVVESPEGFKAWLAAKAAKQ